MFLADLVSKILNSVSHLVSALWCNLPLILLALLGIGFLIMFHEFGHFLFAKLFNVRTPSFSIGFGPRILTKQIGETKFALSAIPLGGYVELAGSPEIGQGEQLDAHATDDRSFNAKPYWQKMCIIAGGIVFNILFAYLALTGLFTVGAPCIGSWCEDEPAYIGSVHANTPAEKAGLKVGDTIIAVNGQPTPSIHSLVTGLEPFISKPATLEIDRAGTKVKTEITVDEQTQAGKKKPLLGVAWQTPPMGFVPALKAGWHATWGLVGQTFGALKNLTKSREGLGGPVMLICQVTQFAGMGVKMFLFMLAFISINLAVFNLLPLPIFDGGQALFFTIEALLRRPLSDEVRQSIHYYTWLLVIALVIYLTFKDVTKLSGWF
jgi:regulator of sigma E protease